VERPPQPLPVGPATLLSLVTSVIDLWLSSKFQQRSGASSPLEKFGRQNSATTRKCVCLMLYTLTIFTQRIQTGWVASSELSRDQFQTSPDSS